MKTPSIVSIMILWAAVGFLAVGCEPPGRSSDRAAEIEANWPTTTQPRTEGRPMRSPSGFDLSRPSPQEIKTLAATLTPEQRSILLHQNTEPPFCGMFNDNKRDGTYVCRLCGLPLYLSKAKFDSGTGWPSFAVAYDDAHVARVPDTSHGMVRVEIRCARCDGHLGHVFDDGPPPRGERHCLNSASLEFIDRGEPLPRKLAVDNTGEVLLAK